MVHIRKLFVPLIVLALLGGACGGGEDSGPGEIPPDRDELGTDSGETTTVPTEPVAGAPPAALRPGLQVTSVDFTTGVAVITNAGERDVDLTGHWICNRPSYAELPDRMLSPGMSVEASLGGFSAGGGEVAVYTSDRFDDPTEISTYVSWGAGGGRQPVAEEAGIWSGDPVQPTGDAIELTGQPGTAAGWS